MVRRSALREKEGRSEQLFTTTPVLSPVLLFGLYRRRVLKKTLGNTIKSVSSAQGKLKKVLLFIINLIVYFFRIYIFILFLAFDQLDIYYIFYTF